jgi:beta propeller repeat protein
MGHTIYSIIQKKGYLLLVKFKHLWFHNPIKLPRKICMKSNRRIGRALIVFLFIFLFQIGSSSEFSVVTDPNDQMHPTIHGNIIVWVDNRDNYTDIYGYDLFTKEEFHITKDSNIQLDPDIYANIAVWMDDRNGNWDNFTSIGEN